MEIPLGYIKIEDSPSPQPLVDEVSAISTKDGASVGHPDNVPSVFIDNTPAIDPRDPEGFLKRCSGFNKKTKFRCNSVIGKKTEQSCHPTFLPTCRTHRDQQSFAGWCQYQQPNGERCSRLFRWTPPYFELCPEHQGHPDTPCYFFRLPLELRHEVFRYLLPDQPIGSSTSQPDSDEGVIMRHRHGGHLVTSFRHVRQPGTSSNGTRNLVAVDSVFPMPALDLFLVNRQFHDEAKDLLFSTVPFTIDVRKDGAFMCGRRLLEPRRADGTSHFMVDQADVARQKFLKYFDWKAVKHYIVDVQVENGVAAAAHSSWDEEVELYDIRDYISVIVSGVLAKSQSLCKLSVRLCLIDFEWPHDVILSNSRLLLGPFESLRNVRQPQILGIFMSHNELGRHGIMRPKDVTGLYGPICSISALPTHSPLFIPGMTDFDAYTSEWAKRISTAHEYALVPKSPIRAMFAAFKDFYIELSALMPKVTYITGRNAFLHLARVARENDDVQAMRNLRNDLIACWYMYLDDEERKKEKMNKRLGKMLDVDIYPASELEEEKREVDTDEKQRKQAQQEAMHAGMQIQKQMQALQRQQMTQQQRGLQLQAYQQQAQRNAAMMQIQTQQQQAAQRQIQAQMLSSVQAQHMGCSMNVPLPGRSPTQGVEATQAAGQDLFVEFEKFLVDDQEEEVGEAGPGPASSREKRRVDSGFSEMVVEGEEEGNRDGDVEMRERVEVEPVNVGYVGKGKGRMEEREVICLD